MAWSFYNSSGKLIDGVLDSSITGAKIAANTITGDKIALGSDAQGDVMYYNGTDWVRLGFGTSGYFLKTQGTGANPLWAAGSQSFTGDTTITSGNLVIATAGKGIDFSAQASPASGMTAELLNHYEIGTWTPKIQDGNRSDGESQTYTVQVGRYVRIGNNVWFKCRLTVNSIGNLSGTDCVITPLPFTSANTAGTEGVAAFGNGGSLNLPAAGQSLTGFIPINSVNINLKLWEATTGTTDLDIAEFSSGGDVILSGFYEV